MTITRSKNTSSGGEHFTKCNLMQFVDFGGWGTTWPIEAAALPCALAILHLTPGVIGGSNKEAQPRQSSHRKNRRKTWNILEPIGLMDTYGYLWDLMGMEMIGNDWKWYVWHVHGPIMVQSWSNICQSFENSETAICSNMFQLTNDSCEATKMLTGPPLSTILEPLYSQDSRRL